MKKTKIIITVCAVALVFAAVSTIVAFSNVEHLLRVTGDGIVALPIPDFPENAAGQTYGSGQDVTPDFYPDLIAVMATNGLEGYAKKEDFINPDEPKTLEEVLARMAYVEANGIPDRAIPVYDINGQNIIGEFVFWGQPPAVN